ncbi:2OG-Fe(II) oxygenase [Polaribacter sp.]|uniref:2OG-Fe(II) oxygenase n=1 Tax=Polaribacter sp. TaxID=1920175 RepID=UPI003EF1238D
MSTKSTLNSLINHPYYLTVKRFIDASGFKISRSSVRESIKKIEGTLDLSKLHGLLSEFFSDLIVFQINSEIDNLDYIITPCFLLHTKENEFFIYVVIKIEEDKVLIFEQDKKDFTISTEEFQNLLKGSIIILKEEETYKPTENILKKYNEEQKQDKEYINSVTVLDDFLSKEECEKIITFCEEDVLFRRSKVGFGVNNRQSNSRTSSSAFMEKNESSIIISDLKEKIATFLGCNLSKIEGLQTVRYYKSEGFKAHYDVDDNLKRKLTCLLYLNDGFSGGNTYFPEIDFIVTPKVGRLLIFQNLDEDNKIIPQSFHQGSSILNGVKYACNIWIKG